MKSCENAISVALYDINKKMLFLNSKLDSINKKRLTLANLKVLFSYLKSASFSRIFRRLFYKKVTVNDEYQIKDYSSFPDAKVVVYTCIWGKYDHILEPYFVSPNIEYRIITDQQIPETSVWKKQPIPSNIDLTNKSSIEINRLFKMKPHLIFPDFDYSVYIDGNIRIVTDLMPLISDLGECVFGVHKYQVDCIYNMKNAIIAGKRAKRKDVNAQIRKYKKEGFPKHFGAYECNVLVRRHNDSYCVKMMNDWWDEFTSTSSKRDQLSLPYIIWKNNYSKEMICLLGNEVRMNPRFQVLNKHLSQEDNKK